MPTRRIVICHSLALLALALALPVLRAQARNGSKCPRGRLPAYAHNDYFNKHPLKDALSLGYKGVEADVFLVNGVLQLGHERRDAGRFGSLEKVYLAPLRAVIARCGMLTVDGQSFLLTIEIKEASRPTFDTLVALLGRYRELLMPRNGSTAAGGPSAPPVQAVLVGWYPEGFAKTLSIPLTRQARLESLKRMPADAAERDVGLISVDYTETMGRRWEAPTERGHWLSTIRVTRDVFPGRRIRVYHVPVKERIYRDLLDAGVDLIGTTELAETARLLSSRAVQDKQR